MKDQIQDLCRAAKEASVQLRELSPEKLNDALAAIAHELRSHKEKIIEANKVDLAEAEKKKLSPPMISRLLIDDCSYEQMLKGIRQVISLPSPFEKPITNWQRPNGLSLRKVRVPIGVIGIIYESRPNVTIDSTILCLKTGNAAILRGGSEALETNRALIAAVKSGLARAEVSESSVQFIPTIDREAITILCQQSEFVDLLIPRGGKNLIDLVKSQARMPVIKHADGICHIYVHSEADFEMAEKIIINAKCQKPGVCNAIETLLIDKKVATEFVPQIVPALQKNQVKVKGDEQTRKLFSSPLEFATEEDWCTEYLDLILSIKIVDGVDEAIRHINCYGSHHSDAIITSSKEAAEIFLNKVDSAVVYWNASTRFTDGFEFGFGAEIGISTDKLHARGPMGLEELTSYKYIVEGSGQTRK